MYQDNTAVLLQSMCIGINFVIWILVFQQHPLTT